MLRHTPAQKGFTLVEVLITIAIMSAMSALIFINLGKPQTVASLNGAVETLVADLRAQQTLAMSGNSAGGASQLAHGMFISTNAYTVFAGDPYNESDSNNYTVAPGQNINFSTTLPDSQILFDKGSGEMHDFSAGDNTITVTGDEGSKTITINRFGVVTVN